jgi:hypothetical protein
MEILDKQIDPYTSIPVHYEFSPVLESPSGLHILLSVSSIVEVEVLVNLRPTVSRPVCLGVGLPSAAHNQIYFISDDCRFLDMGHPLWREDGSVIYLYSSFWALP